MIKNQILVFILRWAISSLGMWLVINLFGTIENGVSSSVWLYLVAGLVFSLINSIVRPVITMLSLPLIIASVGIFTLLINIGMMALTFWILPDVKISFIGAVFGTIAMTFVHSVMNFLVSSRHLINNQL